MDAALAQEAPVTPAGHVALRVRDITKRYDRNVALDAVTLDFLAADVHVLFGENGAGKSTLISMISGAAAPSSGLIEIGDRVGHFESVADARANGVRAVYQEFALIPYLTVAENILLGEEPVNSLRLLAKSEIRSEARRLVEDLGFDLDVDARIASLTRGKQQMVEICKAMRRPPKIMILDEPTASLSERDSQTLLALVRRIKSQGAGVIYVTHRMHEIPLIGDRVSVLRDGRLIATVPAATPENELIRLMTGRQIAKVYPAPRETVGNVRLTIDNITLRPERGIVQVRDASLSVRAGEIVGVAGLVGCGKSELAQACFGLRKLQSGAIKVNDAADQPLHPADSIRQKLWYLPSDRRHEGLALNRSARENVTLSSYSFGDLSGRWLKPWRETQMLTRLAKLVDFDPKRLNQPVERLSGGNQQKVLVAKGLSQPIDVFVLDEPTVGVDVGACQSIYHCLAELSEQGAAILLVSSNLSELMGMTHRMFVMSQGRLVAEFKRQDYLEHRILEQFF